MRRWERPQWFRFGTFVGRFLSDGAACMAVKGLKTAALWKRFLSFQFLYISSYADRGVKKVIRPKICFTDVSHWHPMKTFRQDCTDHWEELIEVFIFYSIETWSESDPALRDTGSFQDLFSIIVRWQLIGFGPMRPRTYYDSQNEAPKGKPIFPCIAPKIIVSVSNTPSPSWNSSNAQNINLWSCSTKLPFPTSKLLQMLSVLKFGFLPFRGTNFRINTGKLSPTRTVSWFILALGTKTT